MRRVLILTLSIALSGCMVGPDYNQPTMAAPAAYKEAPGWAQAQPADAVPKGNWWELFNDSELNKLEPLVSVNNQTLAADNAAFEQAEAITDEVRGQLFPVVGVTGSATRAGSGGAGAASGPHTSGTFEGSVSWSPDIWGKIRRQIQANAAAAQVSAADLANATLSEQALLATDYVSMRGADSQITLLQQTVAAYQRSLQIAQNQFSAGVATPLDVITARAQLEGAQAQLISAGVARAQYEHAIAVLVGHAPADLSLPPGQQIVALPEIPVGVPSTLLQRRPDIAAAERVMAENNAQIGVAIGAFYPTISLSALGGFSANPVTSLFSLSNALWSLGSSAGETIFNGGTRSATVAAAKFGYQESISTYRQTVLTAFQQVEDDLSNLRVLAQQAQVEQAAVADAARAVQIALNEYQAGTQAYTTVVTAQATLFNDQQTALNVQQERLLASISLIQALGGGWQSSDLPKG
ncbi:MAG: efflux transporter outer membrane subunit [Acidocella sp.]|nr:efflux transporter outer membrane subunit [Acidocella sp.]